MKTTSKMAPSRSQKKNSDERLRATGRWKDVSTQWTGEEEERRSGGEVHVEVEDFYFLTAIGTAQWKSQVYIYIGQKNNQ